MATIYYEPSGCNCDNKTSYDRAQINAACIQALALAKEVQTIGRDKYPHAYNGRSHIPSLATLTNFYPITDYEHFSFATTQKPYVEFPVLTSGAFNGDESPGADRIVIGSISTDYSSAVFCAVLTHDASTKNGLTECKDDTVNTNGKGTYDEEHKLHGQGWEPREGRELLERIGL